MTRVLLPGQGNEGGGGVLGLGPATNTFGTSATADRAAAEALRDAYAGANADWLAQYNGNLSFWVRLVWDDGVVEQRRNAAGDAWEDVTNVVRGLQGVKGDTGVVAILDWWAPGATEALPAGEVDRSALVVRLARGTAERCLRYRAAQSAPSEVVLGVDPGIRALAAADAAETSLMSLVGNVDEALPDFAVWNIPLGVIARCSLTAQHDADRDSSLAIFGYSVLTGDDDVRRSQGVGYSTGIPDPLDTLTAEQTPRADFQTSLLVDASAAAQRISFIGAGFALPADAAGHWFVRFEVFDAP